MKLSKSKNHFNCFRAWLCPLLFLALFGAVSIGRAMLLPPGPGSYLYLDAWSFDDTNTWVTVLGKAPISYTNLAATTLGDGNAVVVDSTNPAWLQYNAVEPSPDGTTNLVVGPEGSILMWFAPASWASTNEVGGAGPGVWGRLLEAGWATNGSPGFFSIYLDDVGCNLYFSASDGTNVATYLTAPIDFATNRWHHLALTYSATNCALYIDTVLVTNGPPLTAWPGPDVLADGFFIGSDSTGIAQAHAWFDDISTYNFVVDPSLIESVYNYQSLPFIGNPMNMANLGSAQSYPTNTPTYNAIAGPGNLTLVTNITGAGCFTDTNVWLTNVTATLLTNGVLFSFTISGGSDGIAYDVFATANLASPLSNAQWAWMGQGYHCTRYSLLLPVGAAYLILGNSTVDSDGDGLSDCYERLVSHTDPSNPDTDGDGISDSDEILYGLNPLVSQGAVPPSFTIQCCPQ